MDLMQTSSIRYANSMEVFADGDPTINMGDWRAWQAACFAEGRAIPPAEFKALPKETRIGYLARSNASLTSAEPVGGASELKR